jgi:hypothetical protein
MKHGGRNPTPAFTLGVVALFLSGFLLLVVFGAGIFRKTVDRQYANMDGRGLTAYLAANVRAQDRAGAVSAGTCEYGPLLTVTDRENGFVLRFYRYEGSLVEDLAPVGSPLFPKDAQAIAPTARFEIEEPEKGLFAVYTDAGRTLLNVRSGEEAAP